MNECDLEYCDGLYYAYVYGGVGQVSVVTRKERAIINGKVVMS